VELRLLPLLRVLQALAVLSVNTRDICCLVTALPAVELRLLPLLCVLQALAVLNVNTRDICCRVAALLLWNYGWCLCRACCMQALAVLNVITRDTCCLVAALPAVELWLLPMLRLLQESAAAKDQKAY
jgi:hypothetical protein